ncbi:hypothetical protein ACFWAY_47130 [Rhodococcus sp. NPDC059968]|uniref:hypothetical protein n=1 Tax=Rhodococcus sp. NPDC059968 TaxID=3347017 RepID=UPI00366A8EDD
MVAHPAVDCHTVHRSTVIGYGELTVPREPAAASSRRVARAATPEPPPMLAEIADRSNQPLTQQKPGPDETRTIHATDLQWHSLALWTLE